MKPEKSAYRVPWLPLVGISTVGVGLFVIGVVRNQSFDFWYLPYNLTLAFVPLFLSLGLRKLLKDRGWEYWPSVVMTVLWVLFLPNSFYIVTDFLHLNEHPRVDILQDVIMLMQFSVAGLIAGMASLFIIHQELTKRMKRGLAGVTVAFILFACSFGIYLGRELRWNSWDVVIQPVRLVADILQHLNPFMYPSAVVMTLSFFAALGSLYAFFWQAAKAKNK